jgi:hypothetical protein
MVVPSIINGRAVITRKNRLLRNMVPRRGLEPPRP